MDATEMNGESGGFMTLLVILLLLGGGNGFGNSNKDSFSNEFVYTNLNNTIQRGNDYLAQNTAEIRNDLCSGFGAVNYNMSNNFASVNAGICDNTYKTQLGFCDTNRNIDAIRYENARNTCDIITAGHNDTQLLLSKLANDKIEELRSSLQTEQLKVSQFQQNEYLISKIAPCPVPAYCVTNPNCPCGV